MVMDSMDKISADTIQRSFAACGYLDTRLSIWSIFSSINNKLRAACFFEDTPEILRDLNSIFTEPDGDKISALISDFAANGYKRHVMNNSRVTAINEKSTTDEVLSVTTLGDADDTQILTDNEE